MSEMMSWVKYSWSKGFMLEGRARRREFWWNCLFWELIAMAITVVLSGFAGAGAVLFGSDSPFCIAIQILATIISLAISIGVMLPLYVRRLHDLGLSGWIYLACIVGSFCCCIGSIVLIVLMCQDSKPENNIYGPNPKAYGGTLPPTYGGMY